MIRDKSWYEKHAQRCDLSAKYIAIPCSIISFVALLVALEAKEQQFIFFNIFMFVFNLFAYWFNISTRDRLLYVVSQFNERDRQKRIRDLNPNKE